LQGRVYSIDRTGEHDGFSHPNALLVQVGDSYLCVAGFTPGKPKYEQLKALAFQRGIYGPEFSVEIDHAKELTPVWRERELHVCAYVCDTARMMKEPDIKRGAHWGSLSNRAIRAIADGVLAFEKAHPFLAKRVLPLLQALPAN
jgi:hypothetical protein